MKIQIITVDGVKQTQHINPKNFNKIKEKYGEDLKIIE